MFDLSGKTAVITGGGGGIGLACAKALSGAGASIALSDLHEDYLSEAANSYKEETGKTALCITSDISKTGEAERIIEAAGKEFGGVDIIINSAAVTLRKSLLSTSDAEWTNVMDVNLTGSFYLGRAAGAYMSKQGRGGRIIYIVSTGAYRAAETAGAYSVSKAGVVMLMKTMALEFAAYKINVNSIAPTVTNTRFIKDHYDANPGLVERSIANHPLGRLGEVDDYAGTALYLASSAADFVTGSMIVVDGGKTAK